jgi:hypothetical protein
MSTGSAGDSFAPLAGLDGACTREAKGTRVTDQLPPSKFGAGTTYGSSGQPQAPQPAAPPPAFPSAPPPAPYGGGAYQPAPDPYAAPAYPTAPAVDPYAAGAYQPAPDPYAAPAYPTAPAVVPFANTQFAPPAQPANPPAPGSGPSLGTFLSSGKGAPMTAGILGIVAGLWTLFTIVQMWDGVKMVFKLSKHASHLPGSASSWAYLTLAATVAEFVAVPLLLFGGFLLLQRNPLSSKLITYGAGTVVAANLVLSIGINKVSNAALNAVGQVNTLMNKAGDVLGINPSKTRQFTGQLSGAVTDKISSVSGEFIFFNMVIPALLVIVAVILVRSVATKLWVQSNPGYGVPPTY